MNWCIVWEWNYIFIIFDYESDFALQIKQNSPSLSPSLQSNSFSLWACSNNYKCASILSPPPCGESNDTRGNNISKGEGGGKQGKVLQFMQIKWVLNFSLCKRTKLCKAGKQIANKQINTTGQRWQTQQDTQDTPPDSQTNKRTYLQLQLPTGRQLRRGEYRNQELLRIEKRANRIAAESDRVKALIAKQLL